MNGFGPSLLQDIKFGLQKKKKKQMQVPISVNAEIFNLFIDYNN